MIVEYGSKILFSTIEWTAILMLALSLFRIPLRYNYVKIIVTALIISTISYYFQDFSILQNYNSITRITCLVILIMVLFNIPILYSLLISITGFLAGGIIEYAILLAGVQLQVTNFTLINSNLFHFNAHHFITGLILLLITYFLQSKKIGFMFANKNFSAKQALNKYNFVLIAILFFSLIIIQLVSLSYNAEVIHVYILIGLAVIFLSGIVWSYIHNKKLLEEKYERLRKR